MKNSISKIGLILRGMAMGVAEVIPGISGGTIAFITGVYEDLIDSIKAIGPQAYNGYKSEGLKGLWDSINGNFLIFLLLGMGIGLLSGIFGVTYLMEAYPEPLWAFFFGLILASAIYMARQIKGLDPLSVAAIIIGAVVAYLITTLTPAEGSLNLLYVFISGMIAISALMLPGISGSFILLIMGMYGIIIPLIKDTIKTLDTSGLVPIGVFILGCLTGLVFFSRVLSWLFDHHKKMTFAVLTGFLIGALNKVWPWRNITSVYDKLSQSILSISDKSNLNSINLEEVKIISETNVLPTDYWAGHPMVAACMICFLIGMSVVFMLERLDKRP